MAHLGTRVRDTLGYYLGGIVRQAQDKPVFLWAQAISFKVLIAVVPVLIIATGVAGLILNYVFSDIDSFTAVERYIREFLPAYESQRLIDFLYGLQNAGGTLLSLGGVGLLITAMTLFTTLRVVISSVFQEDWHTERSIVGGYAFDLRMVAQVGLLFLLSVFMSLALQTYTVDFGLLEWMGVNVALLRQGWDQIIRILGLIVPFLLTLGMFFQLFYFIPKPHPPKRSALLGTFVTSLLWESAKYGFTVYASHVGRFSRYETTGEESLAGLGNVFGLIIAFVFWAYFSGLLLIIGAIVALLHEKQRRNRKRVEMAQRTRDKLRAHRARLSASHEQSAAPADAGGEIRQANDPGDAEPAAHEATVHEPRTAQPPGPEPEAPDAAEPSSSRNVSAT